MTFDEIKQGNRKNSNTIVQLNKEIKNKIFYSYFQPFLYSDKHVFSLIFLNITIDTKSYFIFKDYLGHIQ